MTETKEVINIARLIYDAYPDVDLLPINPERDCRSLQDLLVRVTNENIGDGLFRFIVVEIFEGGESTIDGAIRVLERAIADIEEVLRSLQVANATQNNRSGKCRITQTVKRRAVKMAEFDSGQEYCRAAEYLAEQGRKLFTGRMKGGLWNARCMDACILSKKQDDKAAYEFLLKFGDQYVQGLPENQRLVWQEIKDKAAALLRPAMFPGTVNKTGQ